MWDSGFDHYQKIYVKVLVGLLKDMALPEKKDDLESLVEDAMRRSWYTCSLSPDGGAKNEQAFSEKLAQKLGLENQPEALPAVIQNAEERTRDAVLNAPYRIASDFREASQILAAFVADKNRKELMFGVDTGSAKENYAIFKLRYNERIDFFYGESFSNSQGRLFPNIDMKYLGFYSKATGNVYDLRGPMEKCWLDRTYPILESGDELKKGIINAIQREVACRVVDKAPEPCGSLSPDQVREATEQAELAYGKGDTVLDFADKVSISEWFVRTNDPVRFVDEPEVLIKERADQYMQEHEPELKRRWIAHRAAQMILGQIVSIGDAVQKDAEERRNSND